MIEAIKVVLKGIDQTELESPDGWWETSAGAEFGAKKLKYILGLLAQPAQRKPLMQDLDAPLTLNGVALYPQRPWVGLTDEEHITLHDKFVDTDCYGLLIDAVEAKLKEKNT